MLRSFLLPLLITLTLHALVLGLLLFGLPDAQETLKARPLPNFIKAQLVLEKPKPAEKPKVAPKPEPKPQPKPEPPKPKPKPEPKPKPVPKPEPKPKPKGPTPEELKAKKEAEEKQRRDEQRREFAEQQQKELAAAMAAEEARMAAESDAEMVDAYTAIIQQEVASRWSRPPSARNGMEATLEIRLLATGEVIGVNVIKSSGNEAFDRSAVRAVESVGQFPDFDKLPIHVRKNNFAKFNLLFKPEDLRL